MKSQLVFWVITIGKPLIYSNPENLFNVYLPKFTNVKKILQFEDNSRRFLWQGARKCAIL